MFIILAPGAGESERAVAAPRIVVPVDRAELGASSRKTLALVSMLLIFKHKSNSDYCHIFVKYWAEFTNDFTQIY